MKKKLAVALIMACVCLVSVSIAFADRDSKCGCGQMESLHKVDMAEKFFHKIMFIMINAKDIQLTDAQMDKIMALKVKVKKSILMKDAEIEGYALDVMDGLFKDDIDTAMISGLIERKYELKKARAKELVDACGQVRQILSAEQYKKLKGMWMDVMSAKMKMAMGGKCGMREMCYMVMKQQAEQVQE